MATNPQRTKGRPARSPNELQRQDATLADPQRLVEQLKSKYPALPRLTPQAAPPAQQQGDVGTPDGSSAGVEKARDKGDPEVYNALSISVETPGPNQETVRKSEPQTRSLPPTSRAKIRQEI